MISVTKYSTPQLVWKQTDELKPSKYQPRLFFDDVYIKELASSMAMHGVLQPLLIDDNGFIIAGECRFRAAKYIGLFMGQDGGNSGYTPNAGGTVYIKLWKITDQLAA